MTTFPSQLADRLAKTVADTKRLAATAHQRLNTIGSKVSQVQSPAANGTSVPIADQTSANIASGTNAAGVVAVSGNTGYALIDTAADMQQFNTGSTNNAQAATTWSTSTTSQNKATQSNWDTSNAENTLFAISTFDTGGGDNVTVALDSFDTSTSRGGGNTGTINAGSNNAGWATSNMDNSVVALAAFNSGAASAGTAHTHPIGHDHLINHYHSSDSGHYHAMGHDHAMGHSHHMDHTHYMDHMHSMDHWHDISGHQHEYGSQTQTDFNKLVADSGNLTTQMAAVTAALQAAGILAAPD